MAVARFFPTMTIHYCYLLLVFILLIDLDLSQSPLVQLGDNETDDNMPFYFVQKFGHEINNIKTNILGDPMLTQRDVYEHTFSKVEDIMHCLEQAGINETAISECKASSASKSKEYRDKILIPLMTIDDMRRYFYQINQILIPRIYELLPQKKPQAMTFRQSWILLVI